jgi:hypothetical protein
MAQKIKQQETAIFHISNHIQYITALHMMILGGINKKNLPL